MTTKLKTRSDKLERIGRQGPRIANHVRASELPVGALVIMRQSDDADADEWFEVYDDPKTFLDVYVVRDGEFRPVVEVKPLGMCTSEFDCSRSIVADCEFCAVGLDESLITPHADPRSGTIWNGMGTELCDRCCKILRHMPDDIGLAALRAAAEAHKEGTP